MSTPTDKKPAAPSAMNVVFLFFILGAVLFAAFTNRMQEITDASFEAAKGAVTLAIGLVGIMALWLGLMRVLEAGGLMQSIARGLRRVMVKLFPDVPPEHPAMSAMILNISANMLGLGNAATPFGIKAMVELNRLNPFPGMATNAMCLFLAINTSSVTLLPLGVIGVRAAAGSLRPAEIFIPTLIATLCSTTVAVLMALFLAKRDTRYRKDFERAALSGAQIAVDTGEAQNSNVESYEHLCGTKSRGALFISLGVSIVLGVALLFQLIQAESAWEYFTGTVLSYWLMPFLMFAILAFGFSRGVRVYEAVTEGAKQGFDIAVRIIPFLVTILVAVGMFRASGGMDALVALFSPVTNLVGMPAEVLPMAIVRPLSGSGAFGLMSAIVQEAPNSYEAFVASTVMGSTETTFYVLAVYFGAAGVFKIRHALVAALAADVAGILSASLVCQLFWNPVPL